MTESRDRPADPAPRAVSGRSRPGAERILRFLAVAAALCAAAAFPASALFDLRSITVEGNTVVPAAAILERIGVRPGDSAFRVNASRILSRLRSDPRLEDASVTLEFPARLTVAVRERPPVAALALGDGYLLLAANGVAIARVRTPGPYLPLRVDRLGLPWVQAGTVVPSADARLGAGVAGRLPEPLREVAAALRVDRGGEVVLQTRDGVAVRLGGADGIDARLAMVPQVLAAVRARGLRVEYVDLRVPGSVIVKPVDAPPGPGPAGAPGAAPGAPRDSTAP